MAKAYVHGYSSNTLHCLWVPPDSFDFNSPILSLSFIVSPYFKTIFKSTASCLTQQKETRSQARRQANNQAHQKTAPCFSIKHWWWGCQSAILVDVTDIESKRSGLNTCEVRKWLWKSQLGVFVLHFNYLFCYHHVDILPPFFFTCHVLLIRTLIMLGKYIC